MSASAARSGAEPAPAQHLNAKVVGISIAAAVGGFLFGFDTSVINGAVGALSDEFSLGSAPGSPDRSRTATAASR